MLLEVEVSHPTTLPASPTHVIFLFKGYILFSVVNFAAQVCTPWYPIDLYYKSDFYYDLMVKYHYNYIVYFHDIGINSYT